MSRRHEINNVRDLCEFQVSRNTNRLCRTVLNYLEDIQADQKLKLAAILEDVPSEHHDKIILSHVMTDAKMALIRKRILDHGNDFVRDLSSEMQNFKIDLNF